MAMLFYLLNFIYF